MSSNTCDLFHKIQTFKNNSKTYDLLQLESTVKRFARAAMLHNASEAGAKKQFGTISKHLRSKFIG